MGVGKLARMRGILVIAAVLVLAGCTSAPGSTEAPTASGNYDACLYLGDTGFQDAIDLFAAYTTDRDSVSESDVDSVLNRLEIARDSASSVLATSLDRAITEFSAIKQRYATGDPVNPAVDYQKIVDSLDAGLSTCIDTLRQ